MDYNSLFLRILRLDDNEDPQNPAKDWLLEIFDSPPDLPEPVIPGHLLELIIRKHLSSQPIRRFFELRKISKHFLEFLTVPKLLNVQPICESWVLKQNCVLRNDNIVTIDTFDVLRKKRQLIPVPTDFAPCRLPELISTDDLRVSASHGGEIGLIYLERCGASISYSPIGWRTTRDCFALNPMTKSVRQLSLHCSVQQIDRFGSQYLSWASRLGGEEMVPLLLDPLTDIWNPIGFTTRGQIRKEKAVLNEVVYLRYQDRRPDFKDQLIIYDIRQQTFREESTRGLPDNMVNEHMFQHEGHIYLAAVLPTRRSARDVLLYELEFTNSPMIWNLVSDIPRNLLNEGTDTSGDRSELKFFSIDHELLVARLLIRRRTDGVRIFVDKARPKSYCPRCYPCKAILVYDLSSRSWRKDGKGRLGPGLDVHTTIFRPRLDIAA